MSAMQITMERFGDEEVIKFTKDFKAGFFRCVCVIGYFRFVFAPHMLWFSGRKMMVSGTEVHFLTIVTSIFVLLFLFVFDEDFLVEIAVRPI